MHERAASSSLPLHYVQVRFPPHIRIQISEQLLIVPTGLSGCRTLHKWLLFHHDSSSLPLVAITRIHSISTSPVLLHSSEGTLQSPQWRPSTSTSGGSTLGGTTRREAMRLPRCVEKPLDGAYGEASFLDLIWIWLAFSSWTALLDHLSSSPGLEKARRGQDMWHIFSWTSVSGSPEVP